MVRTAPTWAGPLAGRGRGRWGQEAGWAGVTARHMRREPAVFCKEWHFLKVQPEASTLPPAPLCPALSPRHF